MDLLDRSRHRSDGKPRAPRRGGRLALKRRFIAFSSRIRSLVRAIEENDESQIKAAILNLSRSRGVFAPLAFVVGAVSLLFHGVKLLVLNWRLTLVQVLPAMWIWLAMLDLKAHILRGRSIKL